MAAKARSGAEEAAKGKLIGQRYTEVRKAWRWGVRRSSRDLRGENLALEDAAEDCARHYPLPGTSTGWFQGRGVRRFEAT